MIEVEVTGPEGSMSFGAYDLRAVWKYGGYGSRFPGVRRAARALMPGCPVRVVIRRRSAPVWLPALTTRCLRAYGLVLVIAAPFLHPYRPLLTRLREALPARMTTGPPAWVAASEAPVISP